MATRKQYKTTSLRLHSVQRGTEKLHRTEIRPSRRKSCPVDNPSKLFSGNSATAQRVNPNQRTYSAPHRRDKTQD